MSTHRPRQPKPSPRLSRTFSAADGPCGSFKMPTPTTMTFRPTPTRPRTGHCIGCGGGGRTPPRFVACAGSGGAPVSPLAVEPPRPSNAHE